MFINKRNILGVMVFLAIALINVLIIKFASINKPEVYWSLILSIPLLFFAFYFFTKKRAKPVHDTAESNDNSLSFSEINKDKGLTVLFGNSYCSQPYLSSIVCNEAVYSNESFDALFKKIDTSGENNFAQASENIYHDNDFRNDVIWQIEPGYPGCRNENFNFNSDLFRVNAMQPFVKMIELKLTPPAAGNKFITKLDAHSNTGGSNKYLVKDLQSINRHTAFSSAEGMAIFLDSLRELSDRKPVGIRLCVTDKKEFHEICYAFRKTGILPDYIAIEDYAKGNNSLLNYTQSTTMPLYEALLFVSKTLEMYGLEKEIKIIVVTPVNNAFDVLKLYALGADGLRMQNFVTINGKRKKLSLQFIKDLRYKILMSTMEIMKSCNYRTVNDITLPSLLRKLDSLQLKALTKMYDDEVKTDSELKTSNPFAISYNKKINHSVFSN